MDKKETEQKRTEAINELQDSISDIIIKILTKNFNNIVDTFGKDVAFGYTMALNEVHFILTNKRLKEVTEVKKNEME